MPTRSDHKGTKKNDKKKDMETLKLKDVKEIVFITNWKKSKMWGLNPHTHFIAFTKKGEIFKSKNACVSAGAGYNKLNANYEEAFYRLFSTYNIYDASRSLSVWAKENKFKYNEASFDETLDYCRIYK